MQRSAQCKEDEDGGRQAGVQVKKFPDTLERWETELPFAAFSTPSTYQVNGKQYVVVACGGTKGTEKGDTFVAFALP